MTHAKKSDSFKGPTSATAFEQPMGTRMPLSTYRIEDLQSLRASRGLLPVLIERGYFSRTLNA
jgi:hypothetical protein